MWLIFIIIIVINGLLTYSSSESTDASNIKIFINPFLNRKYHSDHHTCFYDYYNLDTCFHKLTEKVISSEECFWDTNNFYMRDVWFIHQLNTSYRYITTNYEEADIIFVPIHIFPADHSKFFEKAFQLFPSLSSKPHIIILSTSLSYTPSLNHKNARYFHYVTHGLHFGNEKKMISNVNATVCPYLWRKHFTKFCVDHAYDYSTKKYLVNGCWKERSLVPERHLWKSSCLNAPNKCLWTNWDTKPSWSKHGRNESRESELAIETINAMNLSLFTMFPTGDACIRNSMFDAFQLNSIPIIPEKCYHMLPFVDVIPYKYFMVVLSDELISKVDIISYLEKTFTIDHIQAMMEKMSIYKHILQYSLEPYFDDLNYLQLNHIHENDDALSYTMKRILSDLCKNNKLTKCY